MAENSSGTVEKPPGMSQRTTQPGSVRYSLGKNCISSTRVCSSRCFARQPETWH